MTILIACDKFKGSIDAHQVVETIANSLLQKYPDANIIKLPMADGGDGSQAIFQSYLSGENISVATKDALGRPINASYFLSLKTAYIELAAASGLVLIEKQLRDPKITSTLGTGILILDALQRGAQKIVLLLGGSSTNDAGLGILEALGFHFFDPENNLLSANGKNLIEINRIAKPSNLPSFELEMMCDVINPMYGPNGAAHIYAKQKGADIKTIELLDDGLKNISILIQKQFGKSVDTIPGGGAAGGISAGLYGLLNGRIKNGFEAIAEITGLEEKIKAADLVISGEGKLDQQSLSGKVVGEIAKICKRYDKKMIAMVGKNELSEAQLKTAHIHQVLEIMSLTDEAEGMAYPEKYLTLMTGRI